jgi:hypothetical protein
VEAAVDGGQPVLAALLGWWSTYSLRVDEEVEGWRRVQTAALHGARTAVDAGEAPPALLAAAWINEGTLQHATDCPGYGAAAFSEAERIYRDCGDQVAADHAMSDRGWAAHAAGDLDAADHLFRIADTAARRRRDTDTAGTTAYGLGRIAADRGDLDTAIDWWHQARDRHRAAGDLFGLWHTDRALAALVSTRVQKTFRSMLTGV